MRLAVIPARGGSKRIYKKNTRLFFGRPIISYSIKAALEAKVFDRIIVSTDDLEIARVAETEGAEVPFVRPAKIADDYSIIVDVIKHAVEWVEQQGESVDEVCCIYATAPMISSEDIANGLVKLLQDASTDSVLAVARSPFPVQRALMKQENDVLAMFHPEYFATRSQDLPAAFYDAGQFAWWTRKGLYNSKISKAIEVPSYRVQDIDTEEDWIHAELMYRAQQVVND